MTKARVVRETNQKVLIMVRQNDHYPTIEHLLSFKGMATSPTPSEDDTGEPAVLSATQLAAEVSDSYQLHEHSQLELTSIECPAPVGVNSGGPVTTKTMVSCLLLNSVQK